MATGTQNGWPPAAPPPFRQTSPQVLELREGGKALALFGLPFFLAGCFISFNFLRAVLLGPPSHVGLALLGFAVIGIAFTCIGAVLMFGRRCLVIDLSRGLLIQSYGLLVPLRTWERPLTEFNAVILAHDPGDADTAESFPVRLRSTTGHDFKVRAPGRFGESRALADYLATFLRLPLVDMISDHETVTMAGRPYQPLQQRLVAAEAEVTPPQVPVNLRSQITQSGNETTVVIPRGRGPGAHILGIVLPLFIFLVVFPNALRFLSRPGTSPLGHFGLALLLTVLFVPPLIVLSVKLMAAGMRKATTVVASPAGLTIEQRSGWRKQTKVVAAADLLDVDCSTIDGSIQNIKAATNAPATRTADAAWLQILKKWVPTRGLVIKCRTELITVGEGLPADELRYVASVLRKAMAAR